MLIVGDLASVTQAKTEVMAKWKCKDLGEAKIFVGFQIIRNRPTKSLQIHQSLYTTKLLQRFGMQSANSVTQPFPTGTVLIQNNLAEVEEEKGNSEYQKLDLDETEAYRQVVGSLLYLSNCTRFDISYAVGQLARFMQIPRIIHLRLAKQVLRYLCGTVTAGILYTNIRKTTCIHITVMQPGDLKATESPFKAGVLPGLGELYYGQPNDRNQWPLVLWKLNSWLPVKLQRKQLG